MVCFLVMAMVRQAHAIHAYEHRSRAGEGGKSYGKLSCSPAVPQLGSGGAAPAGLWRRPGLPAAEGAGYGGGTRVPLWRVSARLTERSAVAGGGGHTATAEKLCRAVLSGGAPGPRGDQRRGAAGG